MIHRPLFARLDAQAGATTGLARLGSTTDPSGATRIASAVAGAGLVALGTRRRSLGGAAASLAGGWLLYRAVEGRRPDAETLAVERAITVGRPADELYDYWHDPEQLSRILSPAVRVDADRDGEGRWRWEVDAPGGRTVTWRTEITEDRPGEALEWASADDALVPNQGSVEFRPAPGDRGTEVTLRFRLDAPVGSLGGAVADRVDAVPKAFATKALHRFKSLAETGEIPTLETNPSGRGRGDLV